MTREVAREIQAEAARWVARMDVATWSEADEADLQDWLAGNPRRAGALLQAEAAWKTLDAVGSDIGEDDDGGRADAPTRRRFAAMDRRYLLAGGGAAIAASIAGAWAMLGGATRYETQIGEIRRVPLADGSTAAINTASLVMVDLEKARRSVQLQRGEAWFQVAKDPARPFVVEAGPIRVQAIGTAFAVRRRESGADILVTEGVVEAWAEASQDGGGSARRIRIAAGGHAFIADDAAVTSEPAAASSIDRVLAWREGKIDLSGARLADAATEFNRYNRRRLVIVDPAIATERFDGIFGTDDPEGFAVAIQQSLDVPIDLGDPAEIRIGRVRANGTKK